MSSAAALTHHDLSILEKIHDPEAGPSAPLLIDSSLPKDPHITDSSLYQKVSARELEIISSMQAIELQIAGLNPSLPESLPPLIQYQTSIQNLDGLIAEYPSYASARNNRAQALRRIYGDVILVESSSPLSAEETRPLENAASDATLVSVSTTILYDLSTAISLLTPPTPYTPLSPRSAKTLSQAYTQRGAFYHLTAKRLHTKGSALRIANGRKESHWSIVDFEEAASRDFRLGGRYGNEVAKALAVSTNPTAKLCGDMVREAMLREHGIASKETST